MRSPVSALLVCLIPLTSLAQAPKPDSIEAALGLRSAMTAADAYLKSNMPSAAVEVLEGALTAADGNPAFMTLLRKAYDAELKQLEATPGSDPKRIERDRRMLGLTGGPVATEVKAGAPPAASPDAPSEPLARARALFRQQQYAGAAIQFAQAQGAGAEFSADEIAAWSYCRVRAAADRVNQPGCDPAAAASAIAEVNEALRQSPANAELQKVGRTVLAAAQKLNPQPTPKAVLAPAANPEPAGDWSVIDSGSFQVRFQGSRETAEAVAKAAEPVRKTLFERWSGPVGGAWAPRCVIVLHPSATSYATSGKLATGLGHATVRIKGGKVEERRIDLRADDAGVVSDTLPRELMHVVLADLFPDRSPPKWAEEGMSVLAASPEEVSRYVRTLARCPAADLIPMTTFLEMKDFPTGRQITGFYCASVTVVDYLVSLGGERNFTIFIRDSQRYGIPAALKRNYSIDSPQALEVAWKRATADGGVK